MGRQSKHSFGVEVNVFANYIPALRVTLKPLVPTFPCFANIVVSLMQKPHVDFGLKILGGDVMSIPGLYRFAQVLQCYYFHRSDRPDKSRVDDIITERSRDRSMERYVRDRSVERGQERATERNFERLNEKGKDDRNKDDRNKLRYMDTVAVPVR